MPGQQKLGVEEKVKIIREYLSGKIGKCEAARRAGVNKTTMGQWVRNYRADGIDAFLPYKNRVYRPEQKEQAVKDYLSGEMSVSDICKKYRIRHRETLRSWIQVYHAHGDFNSVKHTGGGSYMKQGRETTQEERIRIAKDCIANGKNYGEMAQIEIEQLKHKLYLAEMENGLLKKLDEIERRDAWKK